MTSMTSAGTTLGLSASLPATFNEAGFDALTFTEIGEITDIGGDIGRSYNLVTHNPLGSRATVKKKGSYNSGSITVQLAVDEDDAGQTLAKAARDSDANYAVAITLQDGSIKYFEGIVMSYALNVGGVDTITNATMTIEITAQSDGSDIVEKAAA